MSNIETETRPRIFTEADVEQFLISVIVILDPKNRNLFGDDWYETHVEIVRHLMRDYPRETSAILRYVCQRRGKRLKLRH